ncbi:sodium/calcium exchanger membrane region [Thermobaculum terrenum ATCC BAA-798]|uniref:Sodium/calcium exchanger membrane region n=1 Tax=Thermobaculum terrenum (strain ATCC BAA-798 / CCMEE 7001 / YNP1) TaxID=525904 RepID=D1CES6_THET1|nr:sodium/calcium exchanger membrane region [Thermobaculum terrenum]ACZ41432.1 sodium/calcium exchanger membrane region [Thermobaculum terrenum ATCC BAA-798]
MELLLAVLAVIAGMVLLEAGADKLTDAVQSLATRLRSSEAVVGLLTVGGEWEELVVVVVAALTGHIEIGIGNIIGSCIANLAGSLPLGMLWSRKLIPDRAAKIYSVVMLIATALATGVLWKGMNTGEGWLLVAAFVVYWSSLPLVIARGWLPSSAAEEESEEGNSLVMLAIILASLLVLALGAELVVRGSAEIARRLGVSEYAIGATIVAIGTTLPDKAISLVGGMKGSSGVVLANATGSNIFVLTLLLGLSAILGGAGGSSIGIDMWLLLGVSIAVTVMILRERLGRVEGALLLLFYAAYIAYALWRGA